MSIRRTVTIHCDDCGSWEYCSPSADGDSDAGRRARGWLRWRHGPPHARKYWHRCPTCRDTLGAIRPDHLRGPA